jgi:hypothetical protein
MGFNTWVSYEPALGPVDWSGWEFLKWMVSGGESGLDARPSHPDWHRTTRDWCAVNSVPYFFKQWGSWLPGQNEVWPSGDRKVAHHQSGQWGPIKSSPARYVTWDAEGNLYSGHMIGKHHEVAAWATKVGKSRAGALLDGIEHKAMPGDVP